MPKTKLIVKTTRDAFLALKEKMIAEFTQKKTLVQWSDDSITTKTMIYRFMVIPVSFPLANISGYEELDADDVIQKWEAIGEKIKLEIEARKLKKQSEGKEGNK